MDFETQETSIFEGRPIELYDIQVGADFFRFTNNERPVTKDGFSFEPGAIRRGNLQQSNRSITGKTVLEMSLYDDAFADFLPLWINGAPEADADITIFKQHVEGGGNEFVTFMTGKIMNVGFKSNRSQGDFAVVEISNVTSFFSDKGPRLSWGGHCGHNFGDARCGFNVASVTRALTVTDVAADGVTVTIAGLGTGQSDGDYIRGEILFGSFARRYITQHAGDVITLLYPLPGLAAGAAVNVTEGCPHNTGACNDRFNNIANYGGSPYTPNINPFERDIEKV